MSSDFNLIFGRLRIKLTHTPRWLLEKGTVGASQLKGFIVCEKQIQYCLGGPEAPPERQRVESCTPQLSSA